MTLAVAWNSNSGIHLASDSRISKGDNYSDYGVKVTPVHIKVFEPGEADKAPEVAFDCIYGMCFAGDFAASAVVRNFLSITLQRLQYVPAFSEISFNNICRLTYKFYSEISKKIISEIENESIDFFFAGFCPKNKKIMLAKFCIDYGKDFDEFNPNYQVIGHESSDSAIYYIGSGEEQYPLHLDIHKEKPLGTRPLFALRSLISSNQVQSVGGKIQAGAFDSSGDFYMLGIVEEVKKRNGLIESIGYYYSGVDMNSDLFEVDCGGFMVMGNYVDPFR